MRSGRATAARFAAGSPAMTVTRTTARGLGVALGRLEIVGREKVPGTGGLLVAVNHSAYVDGPLVYGILPRPAVFMVKAEEFTGPIGAMLRSIGQIPVRRGVIERAPLQAALGTLAAGGIVAVFPEGSRGAGAVEAVQHGVAYLALRSGCDVLPIACHGTAALLPRRTLRRPPVRIAFGDPIVLPPTRTASRHLVAAAAEQIRAALAAHVDASRPRRTGDADDPARPSPLMSTPLVPGPPDVAADDSAPRRHVRASRPPPDGRRR
jgi:1-acyl-sn-glycerol-3-phosphate acyltransferase